MLKLTVSAVRVITLSVLASSIGFLMIWQFHVPAKIHGWLLGAIVLIFAISDFYFIRLLEELNEVFRRESYSVWQIEQLKQIIPPIRAQIWRMWETSMALKAIIATIAILLQDSFFDDYFTILIFLGYSFLFLTAFLSFWTKRRFTKFEELSEKVSEKEAAIKENRRLKSEMADGDKHDFKGDHVLKSYQNPAQSV
ncbi:MAG: hypothetical protein ACREFE_06895 [Limisphaerales bacterium]